MGSRTRCGSRLRNRNRRDHVGGLCVPASLASGLPTDPGDKVIFTQTKLDGAFVVDRDRIGDSRGFFARTFCQREFDEHGLLTVFAQANVAFSVRKGTVRGMHFQYPPAAEAKLVSCTRGRILDVIVDLRPESPTYLDHVSVELTAANGRALYVPERFAHGYQVLEDETEMSYQSTEFYTPTAQGGLHYDDPALSLSWPLAVTETSEKDWSWPLLAVMERELRERMSLQEVASR